MQDCVLTSTTRLVHEIKWALRVYVSISMSQPMWLKILVRLRFSPFRYRLISQELPFHYQLN
uniref:Uncharacterized protein n=1 Tax=Anguilla anguilla TaxID=7936 RepID=A0A0E9U7W8_ANGAN